MIRLNRMGTINKTKKLVNVSPPPSFGGKEGYCVPEDILAAALVSCIIHCFSYYEEQPARA